MSHNLDRSSVVSSGLRSFFHCTPFKYCPRNGDMDRFQEGGHGSRNPLSLLCLIGALTHDISKMDLDHSSPDLFNCICTLSIYDDDYYYRKYSLKENC